MENNQRSSSNPHLAKPVLCDGFLIPMSDFVLQIDKLRPCDLGQDFSSWNLSKLITIENYAKFLKQPLKLEMFVPCDENGNVLEEPQMRPERNSFDEEDMDYDAQELYDYIKAKEKVLFELNSPVAVETMNYHISRNRNIEYLANFGSIKLTQNSLNAIFG